MSELSHLDALEAEAIYIIREVAAECEKPVMLYSIGKDSSVMVRLAEKAFAPGKVPFPLMHIDSKWKFREMIEFRDRYAAEHGWDLIVESNEEAFKLTQAKYENAKASITEFNEAKNNLLRAQSEQIQARYEYLYQTSLLNFYSGKALDF